MGGTLGNHAAGCATPASRGAHPPPRVRSFASHDYQTCLPRLELRRDSNRGDRDTAVDRFITELGRSMASRTSRADLDWRFAVVNSPEVNAFALPGGFIYVNRGAIEQADRLDEIAGIMEHEIGPVVRRHSVKQLQGQERRTVELVLLCTLTRVCHTIGGRLGVRVGADALSASYSQHDEAEAESEGVVNTLRAGIDPEGLPSFFEKLFEQQ